MNVVDLLTRCQDHGATLTPEPDGTLNITAPSPLPDDLMEGLRHHKRAILAALQGYTIPSPAEVADSMEACLCLGQRLRRGQIQAVRCGITGGRCTGCQGIPCLGSTPWRGTNGQ